MRASSAPAGSRPVRTRAGQLAAATALAAVAVHGLPPFAAASGAHPAQQAPGSPGAGDQCSIALDADGGLHALAGATGERLAQRVPGTGGVAADLCRPETLSRPAEHVVAGSFNHLLMLQDQVEA